MYNNDAKGVFMQDYGIANLNQEGPFSTRELLVSLGVAVSMVTIQLLLLPVQGV